jgi:hypothetical protein
VQKIAIGHSSLMQKLMQANETKVQTTSRMLKGRQSLWLVYREYDVNSTLGSMYTLTDLMNIKYTGDRDLRSFRDKWLMVLVGIKKPPTDEILAELLLSKIGDSPGLSHDIGEYHRVETGNPLKTYGFLMTSMDKFLHRKHQEQNRRALAEQVRPGASSLPAAPASSGAPPNQGGSRKECKNFKKGFCANGSECWFRHVHPTQPAALPAPAGGPHGKGKGKSKGKSKSPNPAGRSKRVSEMTPAEKKQLPCFRFARGDCEHGASCEFAHRQMTAEEKERYASPNRSRPGSPGGKGKGKQGRSPSRSPMRPRDESCKNWAAHGSCASGKDCAFRHDRPGAPAILHIEDHTS